jgi:hypothetical protein
VFFSAADETSLGKQSPAYLSVTHDQYTITNFNKHGRGQEAGRRGFVLALRVSKYPLEVELQPWSVVATNQGGCIKHLHNAEPREPHGHGLHLFCVASKWCIGVQ